VSLGTECVWKIVNVLTDAFRGGAIGAGLFIGSGGAFQSGGPASVLLGFMIIGELARIDDGVRRNAFSGLTFHQVSRRTNTIEQQFLDSTDTPL